MDRPLSLTLIQNLGGSSCMTLSKQKGQGGDNINALGNKKWLILRDAHPDRARRGTRVFWEIFRALKC